MRLPPLPEDQWDERTRAALAALLPPDRRNPQGAATRWPRSRGTPN